MERLLGVHWLFDGSGDPALLAREPLLRRALIELPELLGMTRVSEPQLTANPRDGALAGIVLIAESHLSLHLLPSAGALHGDLFSCRPFELGTAREYLRALYGLGELAEQQVQRSVPGHGRLDLVVAGR